VTGAVRTYAAGHVTAARGGAAVRAARMLCSDPGFTHSTGPLKVTLDSSDQLAVSAATTTAPTAACTAEVESELPAGTTDIGTAVDDACATTQISGATVTTVAASPTGSDAPPALPTGPGIPSRFPTSAKVYQVTYSAEQCSPYGCSVWHQGLKELYFIQPGSWDWHHLAGYDWSYVNCNDNGGIGYTVKVNDCYWGGPNPGYQNHPITANVDYHVDFIFHGFPISTAHSMTLTDWVDGKVDLAST